MTAITLRSTNGGPLSHAQMDGNFSGLNNSKAEWSGDGLTLFKKDNVTPALVFAANGNLSANINHRRSNSAGLAALTGGVGEISVANDRKVMYVHNGVADQAVPFYAAGQHAVPLTQADIDARIPGYIPQGNFTITQGTSETLLSIFDYLNTCSAHEFGIVTIWQKAGESTEVFFQPLYAPNIRINLKHVTNYITPLSLNVVSLVGTIYTYRFTLATLIDTQKFVVGKPCGISIDIPDGANQLHNILNGRSTVTAVDLVNFTVDFTLNTVAVMPVTALVPTFMQLQAPESWLTNAFMLRNTTLGDLWVVTKSTLSLGDVQVGNIDAMSNAFATNRVKINTGTLTIGGASLIDSGSELNVSTLKGRGTLELNGISKLTIFNEMKLGNATPAAQLLTVTQGSLLQMLIDSKVLLTNAVIALKALSGGKIFLPSTNRFNTVTTQSSPVAGTLSAGGAFVGLVE